MKRLTICKSCYLSREKLYYSRWVLSIIPWSMEIINSFIDEQLKWNIIHVDYASRTTKKNLSKFEDRQLAYKKGY